MNDVQLEWKNAPISAISSVGEAADQMTGSTNGRRRGVGLKTQMIEIASEIISEEGISALTARRLAADSGVALGTTYNVFANLGELIAEVNARTLADLVAVLSGVAVDDRSTKDVLLNFALAYSDYVAGNRNRWLALFEVELAAPGQSTPNQALVDQLFTQLEAVIQSHDDRIDTDTARGSARGLWAAVHGLLMLSDSGRLGVVRLASVEPTIDHLITCHLLGLEALVEPSG